MTRGARTGGASLATQDHINMTAWAVLEFAMGALDWPSEVSAIDGCRV